MYSCASIFLILQAVVYLVAVWRTDWERQAQRAQKEAKAVGKEEEEPMGVPQGEAGECGSHERGDIDYCGAVIQYFITNL